MLIKRKSELTGKTREKEIEVYPHQLIEWTLGIPIQNAMPNVSAEDREFIKTGITPEEWDGAFPAEDEE